MVKYKYDVEDILDNYGLAGLNELLVLSIFLGKNFSQMFNENEIVFSSNYDFSQYGCTAIVEDTSSKLSLESFDKPIAISGRLVSIFGKTTDVGSIFKPDVGDFQRYKFIFDKGEQDEMEYSLIISVLNVSLSESYKPLDYDLTKVSIKYFDSSDMALRLPNSTGSSLDAVTSANQSTSIIEAVGRDRTITPINNRIPYNPSSTSMKSREFQAILKRLNR